MGLDCRLLPIEGDWGANGYSLSVLSLNRVGALFDLIEKLPDAGPVPPTSFNSLVAHIPDGAWEGESGYGDTQEDAYGKPLRCVYAGDIAKLVVEGMRDPSCLAAIAYCRELPPKQRIAIFWH